MIAGVYLSLSDSKVEVHLLMSTKTSNNAAERHEIIQYSINPDLEMRVMRVILVVNWV